jgi:SAM-dependent methyltransferase
MSLIPQKRTGPELLDLPPEYYTQAELAESLADIRTVNRYLGDLSAVLKHLSSMTAGSSSFTLLDVATGSADIPVAIVRWARKKGIRVAITAVDINPQTVEVARKMTAEYPEIVVSVADGLALPFPDRNFDFVLCSKTAHHFSDKDVVRLISEMIRVSGRGYLLMDLRRSWIAYGLIWLLTRIFTRNRLTRSDGPLSVLKAFTPLELENLASSAGASRFTLTREPFWLIVLRGDRL